MKKTLYIITLCFFFLHMIGCFGVSDSLNSTDDLSFSLDNDNAGGTLVSNPAPPPQGLLKIFPNIEENVYYISNETNAEKMTSEYLNLLSDDNVSRLELKDAKLAILFNNLTEIQHDTLILIQKIALVIEKGLADAGLTEILETHQSVTLTEKVSINVNQQYLWEADLVKDSNSEYNIAEFKNVNENYIQAKSIFKYDDDHNPVKGVFYFIEKNYLSKDVNEGTRLLTVFYDFTNETKNQLLISSDSYHSKFENYYVSHTFYQCNEITNECLEDHYQIITKEPTREFTYGIMRSSYVKGMDTVCFSPLDFSSGYLEMHQPREVSLTGIKLRTELKTCEMEQAIDNVFTKDLPYRFNDDKTGGTASELYKSGFETITPTSVQSDLYFLNNHF